MQRFVIALALLVSLAGFLRAEPSQVKGLVFVVLAEPRMPPAEAVKANLEQRLGRSMPIDKMETGDTVILFRIAGGTVAIGLMDRPIPNKELDDVYQFTWSWKTACELVVPHKAHFLVSLLDTNLDKVDASLLLTQVVASLMPDSNSIAGYWHGNLQPRDAFLKQSETASRQRLPITLWINYRLSSDLLKGWTITSRGMRDFDLMRLSRKTRTPTASHCSLSCWA